MYIYIYIYITYIYRFCACPKHSRNTLQCLRASVLFARREPDSGTQHC